jgi:hypothetical protein
MACPDRFYKHAAIANVGMKMIIKRKETMTWPAVVNKGLFPIRMDGWMGG